MKQFILKLRALHCIHRNDFEHGIKSRHLLSVYMNLNLCLVLFLVSFAMLADVNVNNKSDDIVRILLLSWSLPVITSKSILVPLSYDDNFKKSNLENIKKSYKFYSLQNKKQNVTKT